MGLFFMTKNKLHITFDKEIPKILFENNISVIFSTYQAGRLMIIGSSDGYNIHQIPISYYKPMGIAIEENRIAVAGLNDVSFYTYHDHVINSIKPNKDKLDRMYLYRASYNTSTLDIHDIDFDKTGLWGVNTLFSCLCKFTLAYNFSPKWKPYFISEILPEDRCHLNGLALENGYPKYVSALSATDTKGGWRKDIMSTGIIMDVEENKIICDGLGMPHSPRIIDGELYFLESARGKLFKWNKEQKQKELIYDFNRFVRGIKHYKGILLVAFSKIRKSSKSFQKVEVKKNSTHAGFIVFDLRTKTPFGELLYEDTIDEIFDINVIDGARKPGIITNLNKKHKSVIVTPRDVFFRKNEEKDNKEKKK